MNYQKVLEEIEKEIQPFLNEGKLANYIPALANVDDKKFAIFSKSWSKSTDK